MKIIVEFNSLEEMQQFCDGVAVAPGAMKQVVAVQENEVAEAVRETKAAKKVAVKEEPVKQEAAPVEEPQEEETITYTLEDVRKKLGDLQKKGHKDEVRAMLQSVGAEKLPEVDPKDYALLMKKAGELDA